ncbi:integrator complex subunit 5-like [Haliotis rufescens]|uniref:integrator complex subunit 5-like n=1 Tax=Haliotis rufescens TaxID=6454 RepID=UPI00201F4AE1|nr:integrator complex subunit 5-like [Haliotis rufescens]
MAAATEALGVSTAPQDILNEVNRFLRGASYDSKIGEENLAQSALFLLRTMPAARHAVLEHFCNVFDEAVNNHLLQMELGQSVTDETVKIKEGILQDISGVLLSFIQVNPEAWAPILSAWSLELLGHISCKYAEKRGMTHSSSLNEVLQLWMTCSPTKLLMELASECFAAMVGGAPDICVDALLEASVKYSPHFDWVVAHIGSCFPKMIITRVLNCGLKDFCNLGTDMSEREMSSRQKLPKMASVVGILGHLASKHGQDIRRALMKLFEESLCGESDVMKVKTVPFLLQLASMSQMLLQVLTTDMIKALTPEVLNKLHSQFSKWKMANLKEYESLLSLVVHLAVKSDVGGYDVVEFLITAAAPKQQQDGMEVTCPVKEVQDACHELMDKLIYEIQHTIHSRKKSMPNQDLPLLAGLAGDVHRLLKLLIESEGQSHLWVQQILTFVALYSGQSCAATILSGVIAQSVRPMQSTVFLRLQKGIEIGIPNLITTTMRHVFDLLQPHTSTNQLRLLKNLLFLIQWEKKTTSFKTKTTSSQLRKCLEKHLLSLSELLLHPSRDISSTVLQILSHIQIPLTLHTPVLICLCSNLTHTFFTMLQYTDDAKTLRNVRLCKSCFRQLHRHCSAQCMLIQFLTEGATSQENCFLFGGKFDSTSKKSLQSQDNVSLFRENQQRAMSMTLPKTSSSVFHAGVIGQGLKPQQIKNNYSKEQISRNVQSLVDALLICCQEIVARDDSLYDSMETEVKETRSQNIDEVAARMLSSVLVERATPDMLYNDTHWPEEEFLRISLERDLQVWRQMEEHPVLWSIFSAFSHSSSVICFLSPVLRCIMGTVLNHYDNCREKAMRNCPQYYDAACCLVQCLGRSKMLPSPLGHVVDLFHFVTPYEGYLLLIAIWRYIKENPPTITRKDLENRVCDAKYTEVVRSIIHSNINKIGHLYQRFFDQSTNQQ